MIALVKHHELDTEKWDACIRKDVSGMFYGLSWYLDILVKEWDALVLNDYEAVFPLVSGKRFGIHYLHRPYGVQQLGVFSVNKLSAEVLAEFMSAIPKKYKFVDVFLNGLQIEGKSEIKKIVSAVKGVLPIHNILLHQYLEKVYLSV